MSKQNPTVKDSEEYKSLVKRHNKLLNNNIRLADWLIELEGLIKQFHYGPVDSQYIKKVKDYVIKEGL